VPVFYAGALGIVLAVILVPRRVWMPLALLTVGIGTFFLVGLAGLSVIDRYLLVPSLMVMVFAAVTLGGWSLLQPGRLRTAWMVAAVLLTGYGVAFTATRVNFHAFTTELEFRGDSHAALKRTLAAGQLDAGRRCGPVSTPNHKLIPDIRWLLSAGVSDVVARSDPDQAARARRSGVSLLVTNRNALLRQALVEDSDDPRDNLPPDGFTGPFGTSGFYAFFTGCPAR
jgi:hypothetical protein